MRQVAVLGTGIMGAGMAQFRKAADDGHGGEHMAAVLHAFRH